jgi:hypothetical protein
MYTDLGAQEKIGIVTAGRGAGKRKRISRKK